MVYPLLVVCPGSPIIPTGASKSSTWAWRTCIPFQNLPETVWMTCKTPVKINAPDLRLGLVADFGGWN